ncbi:complex I subunit 5 family protein [Halobacteriaceae archaeon GCM10025711]
MSSPLPALVVVLPILAAVAAPVAGLSRQGAGWGVALLGVAATGVLVAALGGLVLAGGPVAYAVGGVPAPNGIPLVVDRASVALLALVVGVTATVLVGGRAAGPHTPGFYSLVLLLVAGLAGVLVTRDAFNLFVFLEITGLAAYALVAVGGSADAAVAALRYLLLGTVGATLYLLGVGYGYVATGTLALADLAAALPAAGYGSPVVLAAFGLVTVGLAVKVPVFPLHTWLPDAHSRAPVGVSVLLSSLVTAIAAYALLRVTYGAFTPAFLDATPVARGLLLVGGAASVLGGGLFALVQSKVKRMLAYSTVSQFGLVVLGVGVGNRLALTGAVFHLVGHGVMKAGVFLATGAIAATTGATTVEEYAGAARRAPVASAAFAVTALGLVGVPPGPGFAAKWYVVAGAMAAGDWAVAAVVVASTLLSLAYFARVLVPLSFDHGDAAGRWDRPVGLLVGAVAAAAGTVLLGLAAGRIAAYLEPAVAALLT